MHSKVGIPAILFLIVLFVNLFYTTSQVTGEDSGELIIAAYTLGIPHPPGYPLWSMLGHLFTYIPFGSIAWRVHLLSNVFAALSSVMLYLLLQRLTKMTDPIGKETRYFYDNIGRATKTAAGTSGTIDPVEYFYSGTTGQMTRVKYTNGAHADEVRYYYDLAGQMTRVDDWMGGVGNSDGHFFFYDVMGRVTKYRDFDHATLNPKEMTYSYAANGQLTSMTDFNGFVTAYTYDARHRLSTVTVGGKTWTYAYNAYNMPTSVTLPNGIVTEYVYDDVGRMTKIEHKDGATVLRGWTHTLGNDGGITRITQDSGAYWDYDYDARHRLTEAWYRNADDLALWREKYVYDPGDNVLTKTTPFIEDFDDGNYAGWTTYGTWSAGSGFMQNSVSGSWSTFFRSHSEADFEMQVSYRRDSSSGNLQLRPRWVNSNSARVSVVISPSSIQIWEYDGSTHTQRGSVSASSTQHTWYDVYLKISGNKLEVWRGPKGGTLTQILSVSNIASVMTTNQLRFEVEPNAQYSYDDIIVYSDELRSTTTFTHNNANEQTAMTVDGTTTNFAYDAWGRMTSRTRGSLAAQYAWRYGSFLSNVTSNFPGEAATVNYVYDGLQNRRLKQVNGTNYTWTRYDANGKALADYSNGASYWDIGGRVRSFHGGAEISGSSPQTGTPSYYLRNHLGSVMATTNASKNIVASYQYTPYGEFLSESTTGDHATFGYTGHRLDRELNHYYAKHRYYNPTNMRWLSRDPLGMVDGPNVYAYVRGNVVHAVDPDGLFGAFARYNSSVNVYDMCYCNAKKWHSEVNKKYPHSNDTENDRLNNFMRHCVASCGIAKESGTICAFIAGTMHEWIYNGLISGGFEREDLRANKSGRKCGRSASNVNCDECCKNKWSEAGGNDGVIK